MKRICFLKIEIEREEVDAMEEEEGDAKEEKSVRSTTSGQL